MPWQGNWLGDWPGDWWGADDVPPGSISGSTTISFSTSGTLEAASSGFISGSATITFTASGTTDQVGRQIIFWPRSWFKKVDEEAKEEKAEKPLTTEEGFGEPTITLPALVEAEEKIRQARISSTAQAIRERDTFVELAKQAQLEYEYRLMIERIFLLKIQVIEEQEDEAAILLLLSEE